MTTPNEERVYGEAIAADDAFQAELERAYGELASEARYYMRHEDLGVAAAAHAKLAADAKWRALLDARRATQRADQNDAKLMLARERMRANESRPITAARWCAYQTSKPRD